MTGYSAYISHKKCGCQVEWVGIMEKDVAIYQIWMYLSIDAERHFLNMRP